MVSLFLQCGHLRRFFKSLNAALGDVHSQLIKQIYIVHPSPILRTWILSFQVRVNPDLFRKVVFVNKVEHLPRHGIQINTASAIMQDMPKHVLEYEKTLSIK